MSRSVNSLSPNCFSCLFFFVFVYVGVPNAAEILGLPPETKDTGITIKWNEPQNNGAPITQYNVYQRTVDDDGSPRDWIKIKEINNTLILEVNVTLVKGKVYEFVVTARNRFGEGFQEEVKIKKIAVLGGKCIAINAQLKWKVKPDTGGDVRATL